MFGAGQSRLKFDHSTTHHLFRRLLLGFLRQPHVRALVEDHCLNVKGAYTPLNRALNAKIARRIETSCQRAADETPKRNSCTIVLAASVASEAFISKPVAVSLQRASPASAGVAANTLSAREFARRRCALPLAFGVGLETRLPRGWLERACLTRACRRPSGQ